MTYYRLTGAAAQEEIRLAILTGKNGDPPLPPFVSLCHYVPTNVALRQVSAIIVLYIL